MFSRTGTNLLFLGIGLPVFLPFFSFRLTHCYLRLMALLFLFPGQIIVEQRDKKQQKHYNNQATIDNHLFQQRFRTMQLRRWWMRSYMQQVAYLFMRQPFKHRQFEHLRITFGKPFHQFHQPVIRYQISHERTFRRFIFFRHIRQRDGINHIVLTEIMKCNILHHDSHPAFQPIRIT